MARTEFLAVLIAGFIVACSALAAKEPASGEGQESAVASEPAMLWRGGRTIEIFSCRFDETADVDWDHWPDGWRRRRDKHYPSYVRMGMEPQPEPGKPPVRDRTFVVRMNGGSAAVNSPPVRLSKSFSYVLSCRVRLERLDGFSVVVALTTFDKQGQQRERVTVSPSPGNDQWQSFEVGPWAVQDDESYTGVISLEVTPTRPDALFGAVYWDDVRLVALPRLLLHVNQPLPYYRAGTTPVLHFRISGLSHATDRMRLRVYDVWGAVRAETTLDLRLSPMVAIHGVVPQLRPALFEGAQTWPIPIQTPGYYWLEATVGDGADQVLTEQLHFAVLEVTPQTRSGIFGWVFPPRSHKLSLRQVAQLASLAGLSWVKYPLWFSEEQAALGDELAAMAERLGTAGIELVGLLAEPPADKQRELLGETGSIPAALVFRDPEVWKPLLAPVMTRLSLKVRWWQLAADWDTSYSGYGETERQVRAVMEHFERFGQEPRLVIPWNWYDPRPQVTAAPWAALAYYARPALTSAELAHYLEDQQTENRRVWVLLEPLGPSYSLQTRAAELVRSMIVAHQYGVGAAFVPDPIGNGDGLVAADGSPRALFVPWHTTATLLNGTTYAGTLTLAQGSQNAVFFQNGRTVIALWNDEPVEETLFVGTQDAVEVWDVWGGRQVLQPKHEPPYITIAVGPVPVFVVGVHAPLMRWQLGLSLDKHTLLTGQGGEQLLSVRFVNTFPQGASGQVTLHTPSSWAVVNPRWRFLAAPGEEQQAAFRVLLRPTSATGTQVLRIDVEVEADRPYRFEVLRAVHVGDQSVLFQFNTTLNDRGELVVEQEVINRGEEIISLNCMLFVPNQGRLRRQVLYMGPGRRVDYYVIPNGATLVGQSLWLRAAEIAGKNRTFNYEIPVNP